MKEMVYSSKAKNEMEKMQRETKMSYWAHCAIFRLLRRSQSRRSLKYFVFCGRRFGFGVGVGGCDGSSMCVG